MLEIIILLVVLLSIYFYQQPEAFKRWKHTIRHLPAETGKFIEHVTKRKAKKSK